MRTYLPTDLLELHNLIVAETRLPAVGVGVLPDSNHLATGGYHCGYGDLVQYGLIGNDYSWSIQRDRVTSNAASAIDVGNFKLPNNQTQLSLALALIGAHTAGDPRAQCIRQIIYSINNRVTQFDAAGIESGGDNSHLSHIHISFWRNTESKRFGLTGLVGEILRGGSMALSQEDVHRIGKFVLQGSDDAGFVSATSRHSADVKDAAEHNLAAVEARLSAKIDSVKQSGVTAAQLAAELIKQLAA